MDIHIPFFNIIYVMIITMHQKMIYSLHVSVSPPSTKNSVEN